MSNHSLRTPDMRATITPGLFPRQAKPYKPDYRHAVEKIKRTATMYPGKQERKPIRKSKTGETWPTGRRDRTISRPASRRTRFTGPVWRSTLAGRVNVNKRFADALTTR